MDYKLYAIVDQDNLVINCTTWLINENIQDLITNTYSSRYSAIEYSMDQSITKNPAGIGLTYDESLNAFIRKKPGDNYTLNTETFEWEPNQTN
jgi:hypothetical protein